jgi:hypothetical protein
MTTSDYTTTKHKTGTREEGMSKVIVIAFVTLDGITQYPDGAEGFRHGGWAFRFGPQ